MAKGKAAGPDGLTVEMLDALGEFGISSITHLANKIYTRSCKVDDASQGENWKFDPLPRPKPLTDRYKKLHT